MGYAGFDIESSLRTLFRRCVQCPSIVPSCKCGPGETCVLTSQSCAACPLTSCIKGGLPASSSSKPFPSSSGSKPNTGAIAGGVIGGIVAIGIITFLVWTFCIKGRRQEQLAEEDWSAQDAEKREQFTMRRDARASTHTVGSIASTVFTRASNIIQIAYIPGVTNRSPPSSPGLLVPPVPPLPISSNASLSSSPSYQHDQHFFMPGDLRDSTYSGISDGRSIRTSVTPSLARSSVATTIYRSNAIVEPVPAQTVVRGRAAMVSVKPTSSPMLSPVPVPPVPAIDYFKHGQKPKNAKEPGDAPPPSPAFSVGSTFLSSTAGTAKAVTARPIQVKSSKTDKQRSEDEAELAPFVLDDLGIRPERPRVSVATAASSHSRARRGDVHSMDLEDTDDETHSRSRRSLLDGEDKHNSHITVIEDTPNMAQSPFGDTEIGSSPDTPSQANPIRSSRSLSGTSPTKRASQGPPQLASSNFGSLGVVFEEPAKPASRDSSHCEPDSAERGTSPFGDENEVESLK